VYLTDQDEKNEMDGACGRQWGRSDVGRVLVGKPKERYNPGRPGHRWEDNIKVYLKGAGWEDDWIGVSHNSDKRQAVSHGDAPLGSVKVAEFLVYARN
jgi:hypothetical protein